jgi:hypothetical protein
VFRGWGEVTAGFTFDEAVDEQGEADDADEGGDAPVGVEEHRRDGERSFEVVVAAFAGAGLVLVPGQHLRGGEGRGQVGQQCVPAVGSGFGIDGVGVEVPVQRRPPVLVGADGGVQVVADAAVAGDGVDPGGDPFRGRVVA